MHHYCPACNENVEVMEITEGLQGAVSPRCSRCGLDLNKVEVAQAGPLGASATAPCLYDQVAVADDQRHARDAIADTLLSYRLAREVERFDDGTGFVAAIKQRASVRQGFGLAILDIQMPIIHGLRAADFLRKIEQQHRLPPCPVLLFSSTPYDERLEQAIAQLQPAFYFNKARVQTKADLPERLAAVLQALKQRTG